MFKNLLVNACRLVVSVTFIFSGLVKLIDPVGTQYKIEDYAAALNLSSWVPSPLPIVVAVAMALLEFMVGINLFFGIRRRVTTLLAFLLLLFYTPLTLWIAVTDMVADCGCFGDALQLTNWQTFGKNVILLLMTAILWWRGNLIVRFISESTQWLVSFYSSIYGLFIASACLRGEPIIDFRPFHIGQHIPTAMQWPDDPEKTPEILDFDLDEALLADTSYVFLLIAPHLETADDGDMDRINEVYDYATDHNYHFLCLTASGDNAIARWQDLTGAEYPFAFMDELTLKTIARSNPALLLLHDGTIVGKWSHHHIPDQHQLSAPLHALPLAHPQPESYRRMLLRLLLWYLVPLALLTFIDRFVVSLRWWRRKHASAKNN